MDIVVFLLLAFVLLALMAPHPPTEKKPECPPHKWKNVEIRDETGSTVMWKLVCERCGPPQYTARNNEDNKN